MKIIYTAKARDDLKEIKDYISDVLNNPTAANKIIDKILKSTHLLSEQPKLGICLNDKINRDTDYRYLISGNYGIFYRISENKIHISRILDLRTDYMRIILN